jgi:hypothetical protein
VSYLQTANAWMVEIVKKCKQKSRGLDIRSPTVHVSTTTINITPTLQPHRLRPINDVQATIVPKSVRIVHCGPQKKLGCSVPVQHDLSLEFFPQQCVTLLYNNDFARVPLHFSEKYAL